MKLFFEGFGAFGLLAFYVGLIVIPIAAWINHVIITINCGAWVLLVMGSIVPPIGIVHGIGSWLGAFNVCG